MSAADNRLHFDQPPGARPAAFFCAATPVSRIDSRGGHCLGPTAKLPSAMKRLPPLLLSLLALGAGCAAPAGDDPASDRPPPAAAEATEPSTAAPEAAQPPAEATESAPGGEQDPVAGASSERGEPLWWSEAPVHRGDEVSVCAQATAPTLREARQQAIRAAYDRLEAELGGPATAAAIGSDYDATQEGDQWRFRVRVTGSR